MKAAVIEEFGKPLVVKDVPVPKIGPFDALVKMTASGVCHGDLHAAAGIHGAHGRWRLAGQAQATSYPWPRRSRDRGGGRVGGKPG